MPTYRIRWLVNDKPIRVIFFSLMQSILKVECEKLPMERIYYGFYAPLGLSFFLVYLF